MEFINIAEIKLDNKYLRLDTDVEMLMKSIETVGLINPLILNEDNKLIAGGRRYTAMKALEMSEVPCVKINKSELEQELISIDENLIRVDLKNMDFEKCLSRGREIYEKLYPMALKMETEDIETPEGQEIQAELPNDKRSFIDLTAQKTGLSKKVIKSAIDRDEKSSDTVRQLRSHGELNASQTNEMIKLSKDDQEKIAEFIPGKSAKEIRNIVKAVKADGIDKAMDDVANSVSLPNEYKSLQTLITRTNKVLGKIIFEEVTSDHDEMGKILDSISTLRVSLDQLLVLQADGKRKEDEQSYEDELPEEDTSMLNAESNIPESEEARPEF